MELWENGPQFEQSKHFRPGTDSVLLADFVNIGTRRRGIDLGCGSGILPLLLLVRSERLHMTGLEINSEAARVARIANENLATAIQAHPNRFRGFAAIPLQDPDKAIEELRSEGTLSELSNKYFGADISSK